MTPEPRVLTAVGPRGLELTIATPWALSFSLVGLAILAFPVAFAFTLATEYPTGALPDYRLVLEQLYGRWWLWAGFAVLALLMASDRASNDHFVFGPRLVERQNRAGRFVLNRELFPLSWVSDPEAEEHQGKHYMTWSRTRGVRSRTRMSLQGLTRKEAEEVAARVREWLQAPRVPPAAAAAAPGALLPHHAGRILHLSHHPVLHAAAGPARGLPPGAPRTGDAAGVVAGRAGGARRGLAAGAGTHVSGGAPAPLRHAAARAGAGAPPAGGAPGLLLAAALPGHRLPQRALDRSPLRV